MVTRLVTDALRRFGSVWIVAFVSLIIWRLATTVITRSAPGGSDDQRTAFLTTLGVTTLWMFVPVLTAQAVAFGAMNNRVLPMLPVSRRDIWRAKWLLATLGAATLTAAVEALTMVIPRAPMPVVSGAFTQLVVTWWSAFILGGVLVAAAIWLPRLTCVPRLLAATGVFRNLRTLVVWFLRNVLTTYVWLGVAVAVIIGGAQLHGLLLRYVTMDWRSVSGWHAIGTALALGVAIASYWHRPRVHAGAGRPAVTSSSSATLIPRGSLSATRLLMYENLVSACLVTAVTLGVVGAVMMAVLIVVRHQPFDAAVAGMVSWFGHQLESTNADGALRFAGSPLLFGALLGGPGGRFDARHLRALPISTLQLTALLLLPALMLWLAAITLVAGFHLAVIGTLPRIDASVLVLVMAITALCQPLRLQLRRPNWRLLPLLVIVPVAWELIQRLSGAPAALAHPVTFGLLLTAIAIAWSYWLLTRSATPFYQPS